MKTVKTRIVNKHDNTTNWKTANDNSSFTPLSGEIIIYDDDARKIKIGDGVTTVDNLPFIIPGVGDENNLGLIKSGKDILIDEDGLVEVVKYYSNGNKETFTQSSHNTVTGAHASAFGYGTKATGNYASAEGDRTVASAKAAHSEGCLTEATAAQAHAEGDGTIASGVGAHSEGGYASATSSLPKIVTTASGQFAHAEGAGTQAKGAGSHAEGVRTVAESEGAHAEGSNTTAAGVGSHAEGMLTITGDTAAHAEGYSTMATGYASHSEGLSSMATGIYAHAEGGTTIAQGKYSHAEGVEATASGEGAHAEGHFTHASGNYSHAQGIGAKALHEAEFAAGKYNQSNENTIFSIGYGTSDKDRKNAIEITKTGVTHVNAIVDNRASTYNLNNIIEDKEWGAEDNALGYTINPFINYLNSKNLTLTNGMSILFKTSATYSTDEGTRNIWQRWILLDKNNYTKKIAWQKDLSQNVSDFVNDANYATVEQVDAVAQDLTDHINDTVVHWTEKDRQIFTNATIQTYMAGENLAQLTDTGNAPFKNLSITTSGEVVQILDFAVTNANLCIESIIAPTKEEIKVSSILPCELPFILGEDTGVVATNSLENSELWRLTRAILIPQIPVISLYSNEGYNFIPVVEKFDESLVELEKNCSSIDNSNGEYKQLMVYFEREDGQPFTQEDAYNINFMVEAGERSEYQSPRGKRITVDLPMPLAQSSDSVDADNGTMFSNMVEYNLSPQAVNELQSLKTYYGVTNIVSYNLLFNFEYSKIENSNEQDLLYSQGGEVVSTTATIHEDGLMSKEDKRKLVNITIATEEALVKMLESLGLTVGKKLTDENGDILTDEKNNILTI